MEGIFAIVLIAFYAFNLWAIRKSVRLDIEGRLPEYWQ